MANFAIFGDIHGKQDLMYETAIEWEQTNGKPIDAILQLGDFESIVKEEDFNYYYAPQRHNKKNNFADYCDGFKTAPFLTVFIGGNHEAWGLLKNYSEGGFIAPHIYFLGFSGLIEIKGVKIGGLSGIYNQKKWKSKRNTIPSFDWKYYNKQDVDFLSKKSLDILLLHDWVSPIYDKLKTNPYASIIKKENLPKENDMLSNKNPVYNLIENTRPQYVFMGHKHNSYVEAKLNKTMIYGLKQLGPERNEKSFKVIDITHNNSTLLSHL
ncbi:MAG: metallophosphoesterase [Candidatus Nanoarchaeia archaeon]